MSDPAQIVAERDAVEHLVSRLIGSAIGSCRAGFVDVLEAMADPRYSATAGRCRGEFSLSEYCRQRGITHRRGTRLIEQMRSTIAEPAEMPTPSARCSRTAQRIARQLAVC